MDGERAIESVKNLHAWCMANHYKHIFFFSGGGFHIYILFKNYEKLNEPKIALNNFHKHVMKTLNFSCGDPHEGSFDIDVAGVGDVARVVTFPGTYNFKRKRYCIGVNEEDLEKGIEWIREKAKQQHLGEYYWYGKNLYDIKQHDTNEKMEIQLLEVSPEIKEKIKTDELLKDLPLCVGNILMRRPKVGYLHRWKPIVYFRDYGIPEEAAVEILKKYMTPSEYRHCVLEEKMIKKLYKRIGMRVDISYPNCESIRLQGLCPFKYDCVKARMLYK